MTCSDSASAAVPCATRRPCDSTRMRIGKSRGETEIMRHHDHQRALIGGGAQAFHDIDLMARIERGRRLVRQDHRRFDGKYTRQRDAATLAAGQFSDPALAEFQDVGCPHRPQHRFGIFRRQTRRIGRTMRIAAQRHDIPGRQRPVHDVALRQIAETPRAFAQRQATTARRRRHQWRRWKEPAPPKRATAWSCRRHSVPPAPPDVRTAARAKDRPAPRGRLKPP